ncbi:MAG TPA: hypothetical protein VKX17_23550 [Planctomycetota bacterium]|nr:hypothetical protein [Planctomycetota bacterium]
MERIEEQLAFLVARAQEFDARLRRIEEALVRLGAERGASARDERHTSQSPSALLNSVCLPALEAIPGILSDPASTASTGSASKSNAAQKGMPSSADLRVVSRVPKDAPWNTWRAEWEEMRAIRGAVGKLAPPALAELWQCAAQGAADAEMARQCRSASSQLDGWAQANPSRETELSALLEALQDKIAGEYCAQFERAPAYKQWKALERVLDAAKSEASGPAAESDFSNHFLRACAKKGWEALWDWQEMMERDGKWWSSDLFDHRTALTLTDVFDELNQAEPRERFENLLQALESFLNLLGACRDMRLKLGTTHASLPSELQNCFTDDKSNRAARAVSLQKVTRIKRSRWVRVDERGAPVSELCKASYELQ